MSKNSEMRTDDSSLLEKIRELRDRNAEIDLELLDVIRITRKIEIPDKLSGEQIMDLQMDRSYALESLVDSLVELLVDLIDCPETPVDPWEVLLSFGQQMRLGNINSPDLKSFWKAEAEAEAKKQAGIKTVEEALTAMGIKQPTAPQVPPPLVMAPSLEHETVRCPSCQFPAPIDEYKPCPHCGDSLRHS